MQSEIEIRLPFRMAVLDGFSYVSSFDKYDYKILFHHWDLAITGVGWQGEAFPSTVVTITTHTDVHDEHQHPLPNEVVRDFFLASLAYLNRVIDSYRITEQDYGARNLNLTDLPPALNIWIDGNRYLYLVNIPHWIATQLDDENEDRMMRTGQTMATWTRWPEFMVVQRFYVSARHYLEQGNHFHAVIELETAFELQVRITFSLILKEQAVPEHDRARLMKTPLRNVIEDHFARYFGGNFSYSSSGPINEWNQNLYLLRNKCVHEGKFDVTGDEVIKAFEAFQSAQHFIMEKLIEKGIVEDDGTIFLDKHAPRRQIELHRDIVEERLIKAGLLPDTEGLVRREESTNDRNGLS